MRASPAGERVATDRENPNPARHTRHAPKGGEHDLIPRRGPRQGVKRCLETYDGLGEQPGCFGGLVDVRDSAVSRDDNFERFNRDAIRGSRGQTGAGGWQGAWVQDDRIPRDAPGVVGVVQLLCNWG